MKRIRLNPLDGFAILCALFLELCGTYAFQSFLRLETLIIDRVDPSRVVAGEETPLSLVGNGFDDRTTVQFGQLAPVRGRLFDRGRLEVSLPSDLPPGVTRLSVLNGHGRLVIKQGLLEVLWRPVVTAIFLEETGPGRSALVIKGNYFEEGCAVTAGGDPLPFVRKEPRRLEALRTLTFKELQRGPIVLKNPGGLTARLEGSLEDWIR